MSRPIPQSLSQVRRLAVQAPRSEADIIRDLRRVEGDLSPENLTCDGELPRHEVARRAAKLNRERKLLVAELGREPSDQEIWGR